MDMGEGGIEGKKVRKKAIFLLSSSSSVTLCPSSLSPPIPCPYQISEDALLLEVLLDISNNNVCVHVCVPANVCALS